MRGTVGNMAHSFFPSMTKPACAAVFGEYFTAMLGMPEIARAIGVTTPRTTFFAASCQDWSPISIANTAP